MSRAAVWALAAVLAASVAGCKNNVTPPPLAKVPTDQTRFEWEHANLQLRDLEQRALTDASLMDQVYEQQLVVADIEWTLGWLPVNTYHTRRRDSLTRLRDWTEHRIKKGDRTQMDWDVAHLRVLRERMILGDLTRETYEAERGALRQRLAQSAAAGGSRQAAALADFDRMFGV